jgi:hypothetical protein
MAEHQTTGNPSPIIALADQGLYGHASGRSHMQPPNDVARSRSRAPPELPADKARAGVTGHNVRYVLGFGLAGTILAFAVVGYLVSHGWPGVW